MTKNYLNQYRKPDIRINNISNNSLNASANESKYIKSAIKRSNANNMSNNSLNATTNASKYIKSAIKRSNANNMSNNSLNATTNASKYIISANAATNPNNYLNPATNPNNYLSATAANNQSNNIRIRNISIQKFLSKPIFDNITIPRLNNKEDINKEIIDLLKLCNINNKVDYNFIKKFLKVIKIFCETKDIKLICSIMVSFLLFSSNNSLEILIIKSKNNIIIRIKT
jgi:hypothetical protein